MTKRWSKDDWVARDMEFLALLLCNLDELCARSGLKLYASIHGFSRAAFDEVFDGMGLGNEKGVKMTKGQHGPLWMKHSLPEILVYTQEPPVDEPDETDPAKETGVESNEGEARREQ